MKFLRALTQEWKNKDREKKLFFCIKYKNRMAKKEYFVTVCYTILQHRELSSSSSSQKICVYFELNGSRFQLIIELNLNL